MKNYILTGTPGSGKTTLISALEAQGYPIIAEAATDIITLEHEKGVLEPWAHPSFIDKIILLQKDRQLMAASNQALPKFFDRSPFCTYALAIYLGYSPSEIVRQEIDRVLKDKIYERDVFFIENLGFIKNTDARQISFAEAIKFEKIHLGTYHQFGFTCIKIGRDSLEQRIQKVLTHLQKNL